MYELPMMARLILRKASSGRTMVGGTILADLCPDEHERIIQGQILVVSPDIFRVLDPKQCAGRTMDQLMTSVLGSELPNPLWPKSGT